MPMRLQEIHPSLVHYPITLLPVSIGSDLLGRVTGSRSLLQMGKWCMALTALTGTASALSGLVAQEEVELTPEARELLITHRTLNIGLVGIAAGMTIRRLRRERPSLRYLLAGLAGVGALYYSAYLGGRMVYGHGVGVAAAGGVRPGHGPELEPGKFGEAARHALDDAREGVRTTARDYARGEFVPAITRDRHEKGEPIGTEFQGEEFRGSEFEGGEFEGGGPAGGEFRGTMP